MPILRDAALRAAPQDEARWTSNDQNHHEVFLGRVYRNNPDWTRGTLYALREAARDIRAVAASLRPDWVVFGEMQSLLLCSLILPRARRALYLHGEPERIVRHPIAGHLVGWSVRRVISVSEFLAQKVRRTPLRRLPLAVVPNGTTLPATEAKAPASGPVRLGIVGQISKQKRRARLLDALAQLPANSFHPTSSAALTRLCRTRLRCASSRAM